MYKIKKTLRGLSFFAISVIITQSSCMQRPETVPESVKKEDIDDNYISGLSVEGYYFAGRTDAGISRIDPAVFKRGDDIYLVLTNVGKFKENNKGINKIELHMAVYNAIGEKIVEHRNILREDGLLDFEDNVATKPNARYTSNTSDEPGRYTFTLTVVDMLSKDSTTVNSEFFLE